MKEKKEALVYLQKWSFVYYKGGLCSKTTPELQAKIAQYAELHVHSHAVADLGIVCEGGEIGGRAPSPLLFRHFFSPRI